MKPRILVLSVGILAGTAIGHAQSLWSRTLGGDGPEQGWAVREADDGTILIAGTSQEPASLGRGWVLRLDLDGAVLSDRTYLARTSAFGSGPDGVGLLADGGAIITGRNVHEIFVTHHAWIARIDPAGDVVWSARFFTAPDPTGWGRWFLLDAMPTADGGVVASGLTAVTDGDPTFPWIVKLDAAGAVEWQYKYGDGSPVDARAIVQTTDGGFAVTGITGAGAGITDAWIMKIASDGSFEWELTVGGRDQDEATGLVELPGGGLAVVGWTGSFASSGRAAWVLRIDAEGSLLWNAVLGDAEWSDLQGVDVAADGELLVHGRIGEPGFPSNDFWLLKLAASDGSIVWQRAYEGDEGDWGSAIAELSDGTIAATGSWAWGFAAEALWAARLDPSGEIAACSLLRDTAVTATSAAVVTGGGVVAQLFPGAVVGTQDFDRSIGVDFETIQCMADLCPLQGNVLFAVERGDDVELSYAGANGSEWHLDRDLDKTTIGDTWLPPEVMTTVFTDAAALLATSDDYYYYLRGVCNGVAGP